MHSNHANGETRHWLTVRAEPSGGYTAQVIGLPDLHANAATREQAIDQARALFQASLASGQIVPIDVPPIDPLLSFHGHLDANDPVEKAFLDADLNAKLHGLRELLEICDDTGAPVGYVLPLKDYQQHLRAKPEVPFSEAELDEFRRAGGGPLSEFWQRLGQK